ncbi:MAG: hypothetical protein KTR31_07125 [Myxococcales bacterium]|nr:hypothetical protein [Myxococcales bacterium]
MPCPLLFALSVALAQEPPQTSAPMDDLRSAPARLGLEEIEVFGEAFGGKRTAWVHVPDTAGPWPVLLAFHDGRNQSGLSLAPHLQSLFDDDVLVVFPNGSNPEPYHEAWVGPGFERWALPPDLDVDFTRALLQELAERWPTEPGSVYVTGMGNGGYMAQVLWCRAPQLVRAAFVVARPFSPSVVRRCRPDAPPPLALVLGTVDDAPTHEPPLSIDDTVRFARRAMGCKGRGEQQLLYDSGDLTEVTHRSWSRCAAGALEVFRIANGGHYWPGSDDLDPRNSRDLDATQELWRFFSQHAGLPPAD